MSIQIPPELIQPFTNSSDGEGEGVRAIAALYYNVEDLFPNGTNKYESVIGMYVSCSLNSSNYLLVDFACLM